MRSLEDTLRWYSKLSAGNLTNYGASHAMENHLFRDDTHEAAELARLIRLRKKGRLFGVDGELCVCQFSNKKVMAACLKKTITENRPIIEKWYTGKARNLQLSYKFSSPIANGLCETGEHVPLYVVRVSLDKNADNGFIIKTCYPCR